MTYNLHFKYKIEIFVFLLSLSFGLGIQSSAIAAPGVFIDKALPVSSFKNMNTAAASYQLFSHGRSGELLLNGKWCNAQEIAAFLQPKLNPKIQNLNIYGCEFAKGTKGSQAVAYLQKTLGITVSASTNITGKDGDWILEVGKNKDVLAFPNYKGNLAWTLADTCSTCDFDGDGIPNNIDLDDDNDGILDAVESPNCYYSLDSMSNPLGITSGIGSSSGAITSLYDNLTTPTFAFAITAATTAKSKAIFDITPKASVAATSIIIKLNTSTSIITTTLTAAASITAQGWNGTSWVNILTYTSTVSVSSNTLTFSFPANTTAYSEYRLFEGGSSGVGIGNAAIQEVTLGLPTSYNPSAYPKPGVCSNDPDGDGFNNQFDLDSDGDGCSDAFEAGVTANVTANYHFTGAVGTNGFINTLETATDNGVYNGTYTYANAINAATHNCSCPAGIISPSITPTATTNLCPATTADVTGLASTATTPAGSTRIWSLHNPPTSISDTLTTAQAAAISVAGKYYTFFSNNAAGCYSPADSVNVSFVTCLPSCPGGWGTTSATYPGYVYCLNNVALIGAVDTFSNTVCPALPTFLPEWGNTYTFPSPVSSFSFYFTGFSGPAGCGKLEVFINGVHYNLTSSNIAPSNVPCYPGNTMSYLVTTDANGFMTTAGGSGDDSANTGIITITGVNASSFTVRSNDNQGTVISSPFTCSDCLAGILDPKITPTTVSNVCPATSVNLTTLANTGTKPTGTTQIWSLHNPPTSVADTLTTAEATAETNSGKYYTFYFDKTNKCTSPADSVVVTIAICPKLTPDVNVTNVNVPVSGNMSTNDVLLANTTYGTPTLQPGSPAGATISMTLNSNGTYTFTSDKPGIYNYLAPVCTAPTVVPNCPLELLTITVLNPTVLTNKPVANTDIATTSQNTAVILNTLSNDKGGNNGVGLNPASVTITTQPKNGTVTVNPVTGNTTYTPASGFVGTDTLTYSVCDSTSPTPLCQTAKQIITVMPSSTANNFVTAADDYNTGNKGATETGSVIGNDANSNNHPLKVTPQVTTVPGVGTLTLNSNGTYSFVPTSTFTGTQDFPYTICDSTATPIICTQATLHILINDATTLSIKLEYFNVQISDCNTTLNWAAPDFKNINKFEVERAFEGNSFEKISEIYINNNTTPKFIYFDELPYNGEWQYRLKSIELNNQVSYSPIKSVFSRCNKTNVQLVPNPFDDRSNLILTTNQPGIQSDIKIFDMTGQLVYSKSLNLEQNIKVLPLDFSFLAKGIYTLKAAIGKEMFILKLTKN